MHLRRIESNSKASQVRWNRIMASSPGVSCLQSKESRKMSCAHCNIQATSQLHRDFLSETEMAPPWPLRARPVTAARTRWSSGGGPLNQKQRRLPVLDIWQNQTTGEWLFCHGMKKKHTPNRFSNLHYYDTVGLTKPDLQSATNPRRLIPGQSKSIRQNIIRIIRPAPNPKAFVPSFELASPAEGARGAVGNIPSRPKQTERMTSNKFKLKQN